MSSELFNSITGYSVGIPPTLVVNSSGTILTNVDNDYVTANTVLATIFQSPLTTKASSATGTIGQICWDANYIYVCTAINTWKRATLTGGY